MTRALTGLRVLDLSEGIAGAYCTKLLADFGADVLKVEPSGGDSLRALGPFPGDVVDLDRGGMFAHLAAGKRSMVVDLDAVDAGERIRRLTDDADVVVESFTRTRRDALGLSAVQLIAENPPLVVTTITPFGTTGPYSDWPSSEITEWAMGGYMYFGGEADREPLMVPGHQARFHGGMQAAFATLAATWHARRVGQGQHIDVSHWESLLSAHAWLSEMWTHCGAVQRRRGSDFIECSDGVAYILRAAFYNPNLFILIEHPELASDPRWQDTNGWFENTVPLWEEVQKYTRVHSKQEFVTKAQELRMAATPVNNVADLAASPQLEERGWWLDLPDGPRIPGAPYKLSDSEVTPTGPPPALGEQTETAANEPWPGERMLPLSARTPASNRKGPLAGIKIVELTSNWAGPLAGRMLGDLGAEIVKVEIASRPAARVHYYAGNEPGKYHYNRAGYFNHLNRNKVGISLDIAAREGLEVFHELVRWADVFIENNSPRVVRNLGITHEELANVNPGIIMLSLSGFGHSGPHSEYVAFGTNIEASSGLVSVMGYGSDENQRTGSFYADPIAGSHGAIAIVAALLQREVTGRGQHIDLSLQEASAGFLSQFLMDYILNRRVAKPTGNRSPTAAPQGCYRTAGDDMWMVLSVDGDDQWRRFCEAIGYLECADRPEFATAEKRRQNHDALDDVISVWAAELDHWEAAKILLEAGIPAAPVMTNWEIVSDPHVAERGFYVPVSHPEAGVLPYPGFSWHFSETPGSVYRPAPCFAEHQEYVLGELLGLSDDEIQTLDELGLTKTIPETPILRGTL